MFTLSYIILPDKIYFNTVKLLKSFYLLPIWIPTMQYKLFRLRCAFKRSRVDF